VTFRVLRDNAFPIRGANGNTLIFRDSNHGYMKSSGRPTVLVVDDEPDMTSLCEAWLSDDADVRVANSGRDALETVDEDVDVVLLDRRMPDLLGSEVLERIRDHGYDCRVAMLTAVSPDTDIVDMGFDTYLTKPIDADELRETVQRLEALDDYDDSVGDLYSLVEKRVHLERTHATDELEDDDAYQTLLDRIDTLEERIDRNVETLDDNAFRAAFSEL